MVGHCATWRYRRLKELLGQGQIEGRSAVERYRYCLAFAHEIDQLLRAARVPVRDMIDAALQQHHGNMVAAAKSLGISRKGLYLKRHRLGL